MTYRHLLFCALLSVSVSAYADHHEDAENTAKGFEGSEASENDDTWSVNEPPGPQKTISIDTQETTWTNLDVSPDGQTLVFDMLGDLYSVSLEGGEATALTSDIAWNMQPKFSPDGSEVAFISDRNGADNLWVMNADGSGEARELTKEKGQLFHNPAWSPDGQWLAARKGYVGTRSIPAGEIWLVHAGGGGKGLQVVERIGKKAAQKNIAEPAFSPDGRYLYYSKDVTGGVVWQYNKDSTGQIFAIQRLDRETGKTVQIAGGPGGAIRPVPSPDGKHLAFVKRSPDMTSEIMLKDLESGLVKSVVQGLDRDLQETNGAHGNTPAFAFTPDGDSLVYWAGGKIRRVAVSGGEATEIPVRVKTQRTVREALRFAVDPAPEKFPVRAMRWAQYSPDGSQVVFQALGYLYLHDVASGERRRLTRQSEHFEFWPSFSADGKSIVYTTWDDQDLGTVRTVSSRGGRGKVLTEQPGHYVEARFSPNGKQVVYRKFAGGRLLSPLWSEQPGLYTVSAKGGESTKLVDDGFNPQFSADGTRVFFSDFVENTELVLNSVNLSGLDERSHLKGSKITEFSVSPNGQWVAFTESYNAFVAPLPQIGKRVDLSQGSDAYPVSQVAKRSGEGLHWSADSDTLSWALGATLYSRDLKDSFSFLAGVAKDDLPEPVEAGLSLSFDVETDVPTGIVAITNARVVTMRNADSFEEVLQSGTIVIEGNRIATVGPGDEVTVPEGAYVVDASGHTVIPGLVDVHAHGGMASNELTPQQNWQQYSNVSFGVTTIHDPSNDTTEIFSHAELQQAGQVIGPRTFSTGTILYGAKVPGFSADITSLEDARFHLQRLKDMGAISVKSYNQLRRDSRQQVIAAGQELGIMVVPEGGAKWQHNLTHIVDGHTGLEHAVPLAHVYDDVKQLWSQTDVGYTPTFGVAYGGISGENYWYDRDQVWKNPRLLRYTPKTFLLPRAIRRERAPDEHYNHIAVARHAKALRDMGVSVQIGAHGQREGLAAHWEMWMMQQGGFSAWEALRGATIDGARYIGLDASVGSIEVGKLADLAIIKGNPLDDLRQSEMVAFTMVNGRLYEAATMNEVGNRQRQREPFFFELEGGDAFPASAQKALKEKQQALHWRH
ncbi:MAG: amidohydrolase family protein [Lysobacterales bacterium]